MTPYANLGHYSRPITTVSPSAQTWFDRGLMWTYGFNHEEAILCFKNALEHDPDCAMAYWGIAYANGPFYNKPWEFYGAEETVQALATCYSATQNAVKRMANSTAAEQALIRALSHRYPTPEVVSASAFIEWEHEYARQMGLVYEHCPQDTDIIALYAEAMMNKTPWQLWDVHAGEPAKQADTVRILEVLETGLQLLQDTQQTHPGVYHMYIHAIEMSPYPEKGLKAADALRDLAPDSGHLCHMPSHIDLLCGHYQDAIVASHKAVKADNKYLARVGKYGFYTTGCCHDMHLLMYAAMLSGQFRPALEAANGIETLLSEDVLRTEIPHLASTLEAYYSMKMHVLVRFGKWDEILAVPAPTDAKLYCVTQAMYHYARGIAYSVLGEIALAEAELEKLERAIERISPDRRFFNNKAQDVVTVGQAMLLGELTYRKGDSDKAFTYLRQAVYLDDNLAYTEPWAWMHPPRHALGALLLEQGKVEEAEQVYRADLGFDQTLSRPSQRPSNVWSLHGYVECLRIQANTAKLRILEPQLALALARTDVEINASCFCKVDMPCCH